MPETQFEILAWTFIAEDGMQRRLQAPKAVSEWVVRQRLPRRTDAGDIEAHRAQIKEVAGFHFNSNMKKFPPLLLLLMSVTASADWVKILDRADTSAETFIDVNAIRQTGPMNTMRRVWELKNLAKGTSNKVLSIKHYMEYDCKDRRFRALEESNFFEYWAQGESLAVMEPGMQPGHWRDIGKGSLRESIFKRVCPHDESDASKD